MTDRPLPHFPQPPAPDVFLSYPHRDRDAAHAFAGALLSAGLSVWLDATDIDTFDRIDDRVAQGIAGARVLVAWYSTNYAASRACQWELAAAWSNGDGARVLAINPEAGAEHLMPRKLLDRLLPGSEDIDAVAAVVKTVVGRTQSPIGDGRAVPFAQPLHYGRQLAGSNRFVGRVSMLWALHDALTRASNPMLSGTVRSIVQLRGFGGVGKSMLAEEYALRFGPAWPGGICWLDAHGQAALADPGDVDARSAAERDRQFAAIACALGVSIAGRTPAAIRAALGKAMASGPRCLWIVDDLPSGLSVEAINGWLSPQAGVPTLFTTRDRRHGSLGIALDVDVLSPDEALALLERHRPLQGAERDAACRLLDQLGHHALAVEVAASFLGEQRGETVEGFMEDLRDPDEDVLELAGELSDALPFGHSPSIVATLDGTIRRLDEDARDLLCLAACVDTAPLPVPLLDAVLAAATATTTPATPAHARTPRARRLLAVNALDRFGLCRPVLDPPGALAVHALVARTALRDPWSKARSVQVRAAAAGYLAGAIEGLFTPSAVLRHGHEIAHARALCAAPSNTDEAILLSRVAGKDLQRGDLAAAEEHARRVLAFAGATSGIDPLVSAHARSVLAAGMAMRGELEAAGQALESARALFMQRLPVGSADRIEATAALGWARAAHGDLKAGRNLCEEALAEVTAEWGAAHDLSLNVQGLLARVLQLEGDFDGAQRLQQQVAGLRARRADAGDPEDLDALTDALMMAQTTMAAGDAAGAAPVLAVVADAFERTLGPDNVLTLSAQLSRLFADAQRDDPGDIRARADALSARMLPLFGEAGPGASADAPTGLVDLGVAIAERDVEALLRWTASVADSLERRLGARHPAVLANRVGTAQLAWANDEFDRSRDILDAVLPLAAAVLGDGHPCTVDAMICLASVRSSCGDAAGACALLETAAAAREAIAGPADRKAIDARLECNDALHDLGEHVRCSEGALALLPLCEQVFAHDSQAAQGLRFRLVSSLVQRGVQADSDDAWDQVLATAEGALRADDPLRLMLTVPFAHYLLARESFARCRTLMETALAPWVEAPPAAMLDTSLPNAIGTYALALHALGDWGEAALQWQRLLDADTETDAEQVLTQAHFLFVARWNEGRRDACRAIFERYFAVFCRDDSHALTGQQQRVRDWIRANTDWLQ